MDVMVGEPSGRRISNRYSTDPTPHGPWPLAGREPELGFVAEALAAGAAGGVVVAGPAGVGKTRLVLAAADRAADCDVAWVRATR